MRAGLRALAAVLCLGGLVGCGHGSRPIAEALARRELRCAPPALRLRAVGVLRVGPGLRTEVALYEASGCDQEQLYVCPRGAERCGHDFGALGRPEERAALERAHALLRSAARARCPESELVVTQESESLFRFASCDGSWLFHCRARGCERLPSARP